MLDGKDDPLPQEVPAVGPGHCFNCCDKAHKQPCTTVRAAFRRFNVPAGTGDTQRVFIIKRASYDETRRTFERLYHLTPYETSPERAVFRGIFSEPKSHDLFWFIDHEAWDEIIKRDDLIEISLIPKGEGYQAWLKKQNYSF